MSKEAFQQWDMFTGEPVTIYGRSDQQPLRQIALFSVNEIVQLGVSAHPWLKDMPAPILTLERQDTRTEEEKERDQMREAEKLTTPLFGDVSPPDVITESTSDALQVLEKEVGELQNLFFDQAENQITTDETTELEDNEDEQDLEVLHEASLSKHEAYLSLVNVAEERAETLYSTSASELSETITMSKAKLDARLAGLTDEEIATALMIGEFRGKAKHQLDQAETIIPTETQLPHKDIPILWMCRADLLKRRPDLIEKISALSDDEVDFLAKIVGGSLEEMYWMMLNVVLSLYLDHELQLRLVLKPEKNPSDS